VTGRVYLQNRNEKLFSKRKFSLGTWGAIFLYLEKKKLETKIP
jgi:hypothetical protein